MLNANWTNLHEALLPCSNSTLSAVNLVAPQHMACCETNSHCLCPPCDFVTYIHSPTPNKNCPLEWCTFGMVKHCLEWSLSCDIWHQYVIQRQVYFFINVSHHKASVFVLPQQYIMSSLLPCTSQYLTCINKGNPVTCSHTGLYFQRNVVRLHLRVNIIDEKLSIFIRCQWGMGFKCKCWQAT